jgi:hypothetical protein
VRAVPCIKVVLAIENVCVYHMSILQFLVYGVRSTLLLLRTVPCRLLALGQHRKGGDCSHASCRSPHHEQSYRTVTTYNLQLTTYNLQPTTYNLQPTTYNLQLKQLKQLTNRPANSSVVAGHSSL